MSRRKVELEVGTDYSNPDSHLATTLDTSTSRPSASKPLSTSTPPSDYSNPDSHLATTLDTSTSRPSASKPLSTSTPPSDYSNPDSHLATTLDTSPSRPSVSKPLSTSTPPSDYSNPDSHLATTLDTSPSRPSNSKPLSTSTPPSDYSNPDSHLATTLDTSTSRPSASKPLSTSTPPSDYSNPDSHLATTLDTSTSRPSASKPLSTSTPPSDYSNPDSHLATTVDTSPPQPPDIIPQQAKIQRNMENNFVANNSDKMQPISANLQPSEKLSSAGQPSQTALTQSDMSKQSSTPSAIDLPINSTALLSKQPFVINTDALAPDTTQPNKIAAIGLPGEDAVSMIGRAQLSDAANSIAIAHNALSPAQLLESMQKNIGLSRESNSALLTGTQASSDSTATSALKQTFDTAGKQISQGMGLTVKESGATYSATSATTGNTIFGAQAMSQTLKEAQLTANTSNSQSAAQALQGLLQQGQAANGKLDETGKPIVKGAGAPGLTDALTTTQGGKIGAAGTTESIGTAGMGMLPGMLITKGGKGGEVIDETKLPVGQTGNATTTGIIITATAGATITGQTGVAGQTGVTGQQITTTHTTTGTGTTSTVPGAKDTGATDIKSLLTTLPTVEISDSKKGPNDQDEDTRRPEIDFDSIEDSDFDDDEDDFIDTPAVDGKRANSTVIETSPKKPSKLGLSIIENIMVLMNDLKNQKVDDKTARRMWADLFTDLFGKQKRQPYGVRTEDTLESIARYVLKDARLAPLLYTINVHTKKILSQ